MANNTVAPSSIKPTKLGAVHNSVSQSTTPTLGYEISIFIANANLLIGDVVYFITTAGRVDKSATNANYRLFAGVVVGGASFDSGGHVATDAGLIGALAATSGQDVILAIDGSIVYGIVGSAITAGQALVASAAVAGRVIPDPSAKPVFAIALEANSTVGGAIKMYIRSFASS